MRLNFAEAKAFQGKALPTETQLVGLSALVQILSVAAPVRRPSAVSEKHIRGSHRDEGDWRLFDKRYWPGDNFADHLTFALRHEDLDLLVLKRVFKAVPKAEIRDFVTAAPTGVPARRVWFLYEMLTGETLDIPDTPNVAAVDLFDPKAYFTGKPKLSKRHRVRNNLLGTKDFSPVIRRTSALVALTESGLAEKARETVGRTGGHVVSRAASFLLLADSRASFEIEGERPPRNRLERWGRAVVQAGKHALTLEEIVRLHSVLIEDTRLIHPGLRPDGVFLGERDHENNPLPEFIGARPDDLTSLMKGLIDANARMRDDGIDAVLQAASTAFGFVYVHPLQDGNGRLHRCLIHHVLAERKFTPPGMVFPVSSVMLDRIDDYRTTLQSHSGPLMEFIDWKPTSDRNVEVLNDTADLYCYFDCTDEAEFLYQCVKRTVEHDLPHEIDYLRRHDEARRKIMDTVEMPDRLADDLLLFIRQNKGVLSKKRREREFEKLTDDEVASIEAVVRDAFEGFEDSSNEQNHAP
ncbi:Fic family protein [Bradyrhizobium valentinum]|uniref:Cell filamentation protein Fic n=1 Tax=Bradyrhizobium valentinum TaxID=1518501 RepID=A0A0R3LTP9_9BRAD|nr:Fic family protein [Bradyrhizobium valentinum]KRR11415.1 cell filamentation protein Fic [Bradyrhizobium valentinum]